MLAFSGALNLAALLCLPRPRHIDLVHFFLAYYDHHRPLHSFPTRRSSDLDRCRPACSCRAPAHPSAFLGFWLALQDRKSTRLNSSHLVISYAVFCLKKKNKQLKSADRVSRQQQRHTASERTLPAQKQR